MSDVVKFKVDSGVDVWSSFTEFSVSADSPVPGRDIITFVVAGSEHIWVDASRVEGFARGLERLAKALREHPIKQAYDAANPPTTLTIDEVGL